MRTQLLGLAFDELKIAVVAEVHVAGQRGTDRIHKMVGEFGAKCADAKLLKKLQVIEDDKQLFDRGAVRKAGIQVAYSLKAT